jgi:hypothetical protein
MLSKLAADSRPEGRPPLYLEAVLRFAGAGIARFRRAARRPPKSPAVLSEAQSLLLKTRMGELELTAVRRVTKRFGTRPTWKAKRRRKDQDAAAVRAVVEKLAQSIQELAGLRAKLRSQAEADVVRLAMAIAKRVVHRELSTDPDSIIGLVKVALEKLRLQETVRVRVHPDHVAIVKEFLSRSAGHPRISR